MYSLDVNFLEDRKLAGGTGTGNVPQIKAKPASVGEQLPILAGVVAMVLIPALVGGALFWVNSQKADINAQIAAIDAQIKDLDAKGEQVKTLQAQLDQEKAQTAKLASVFTQFKPISAILQDIRDQTPPGVQLDSITQTEEISKEQGAKPEEAKPIIKFSIKGFARSYNDVNDFLLTLQNSKFLNPTTTKLASATLVENPTEIEMPEGDKKQEKEGVTVTVELPQVVEYTIETELNDIPTYQLVKELESKGAVGLVTRIKTLEEQGVIQP